MYIQRQIKQKFEKLKNIYPIIAIVGARQSGKTTFLKQQIKNLKSSYLLFDDPDIRELFEKDIKKFEIQNIRENEVSVLDEVQYCKNAGINLKYLADNNKKLWITASSEIILSKEVLSYLVGRVSVLKLYPFSIFEFLDAKKQKQTTEKTLQRNIWEHMVFGGYPKVILTQDPELKKTILQDLYTTMILKDVARTFSIEDINSLEKFSKYLSLNKGHLISYETLSKDLGMSFQTIKKYLDAMEKSYFITRISPFFTNKTKEISKQPKIYFIDTGLRNNLSKTFDSEPSGELFENYVLSELIKSGFSPKYWRTKSKVEVDFIIEKNKEIIPIEVKIKSEKISKSLKSFIKEYNSKKAFIVIYKGNEKTIKIKDCKIFFVNIINLIKNI